MKQLWIALSFTALISVLSACSELQSMVEDNVEKPEVSYQSLSIGDISRDGIELKPTFSISNGNAFSVPVDSLNYELSFNQKRMLTGSTDAIGKIPAKGAKDVTLSVPLNKEVFDAFAELLTNNKKLDYVIKGEASILGFKLPFEKAATFYRPSISIGDFSVNKSSFKEVQLNLTLDIDNPNDFTLPLSSISYAASSGKKALFSGELTATQLKQGKNQLQLPVTLRPGDLFSSLFSMLKDPNLPLSFNVDSPLQKTSKTINLNFKDLLGK